MLNSDREVGSILGNQCSDSKSVWHVVWQKQSRFPLHVNDNMQLKKAVTVI